MSYLLGEKELVSFTIELYCLISWLFTAPEWFSTSSTTYKTKSSWLDLYFWKFYNVFIATLTLLINFFSCWIVNDAKRGCWVRDMRYRNTILGCTYYCNKSSNKGACNIIQPLHHLACNLRVVTCVSKCIVLRRISIVVTVLSAVERL